MLSEFLKNNKEEINKLNSGDDKAFLKKEKEKFINGNKLKEDIIKVNYIEQFNDFIKNSDSYNVGYMIKFNYNSVSVLTSDLLLKKVMGIPKSSFLIATLKNFDEFESIEHFILLSISDFSQLEDSKNNQLEIINLYKNNKMIESSNLKEKDLFEYNGFDCKVLGMFYKDKENQNIFNYTPQVNLILSPKNYIVCKPNDEIKNIIVNHKMIKAAFKEDFNIFELGLFKETESEVFTNETNVKALYDLKSFVNRRTALFGKTRLGKSNTNKELLSNFIQYNELHKHDVSQMVGNIVYDVNGEYANKNSQDGTSLYEKYKNTKLVKKYTLNKNEKNNLMINFFINPIETMSVFSYVLKKEKSSIYLESFLNIEFFRINYNKSKVSRNEKVNLNYFQLTLYQLFWVLLQKSGFKLSDETVSFLSSNIDESFIINNEIYNLIYNLIDEANRENLSAKYNKSISGNKLSDLDKFNLMNDIYQILIDKYIESGLKNNVKFMYLEPILEMFNTSNKAGYKILRKTIEYHSEKSNNSISELIKDVCENGLVAIIDLSKTTSSDVKTFYAMRISKIIFNEKVNQFIQNKTNENPNVISWFEEAHNLFPQGGDAKDGSIYFKLAREGAKYGMGIVYSTQSPSNIYDELLNQTENFFIGHLSSPKEIAALNSLTFNFKHMSNDIMEIKKTGYMRVLTDNHSFPISVMIKKFE